jgi:hypothetical protein
MSFAFPGPEYRSLTLAAQSLHVMEYLLLPLAGDALSAKGFNKLWEIGPRIIHLLFGGSPTTVPRFVIAIIINSVNAPPIRPIPHVTVKIPEGFFPVLTHRDSTLAVIYLSACWVTPVYHSTPYIIFSGMRGGWRHFTPVMKFPRPLTD